MPEGAATKSTFWSWEGFYVALLPFLNMIMTAAAYTFLPLHFLDTKGFELSTLRFVSPRRECLRCHCYCNHRVGDWTMLLFLSALLVPHVFLLMDNTENVFAVVLTYIAMFSCNSILSLQGLVHQVRCAAKLMN